MNSKKYCFGNYNDLKQGETLHHQNILLHDFFKIDKSMRENFETNIQAKVKEILKFANTTVNGYLCKFIIYERCALSDAPNRSNKTPLIQINYTQSKNPEENFN